jgi:hypothetical protein
MRKYQGGQQECVFDIYKNIIDSNNKKDKRMYSSLLSHNKVTTTVSSMIPMERSQHQQDNVNTIMDDTKDAISSSSAVSSPSIKKSHLSARKAIAKIGDGRVRINVTSMSNIIQRQQSSTSIDSQTIPPPLSCKPMSTCLRNCISCKQQLGQDKFSSFQWNSSKQSSMCKNCVNTRVARLLFPKKQTMQAFTNNVNSDTLSTSTNTRELEKKPLALWCVECLCLKKRSTDFTANALYNFDIGVNKEITCISCMKKRHQAFIDKLTRGSPCVIPTTTANSFRDANMYESRNLGQTPLSSPTKKQNQ